MTKYIDINTIKQFLLDIIDAPVVELPEYILGTSNNKLIKTEYWGGGEVTNTNKAGDICFYDSQKNKKVIVAFDTWNADPSQYPSSRYTPIGVVVIPSSHDVWGTGQCGVMSIVPMSCSAPDTGATSETTMYWGYNSKLLGDAITGSVYCGTTASPTTEITGVATSNRCLPSDTFSSTQCPTDPTAYYYYNNSSYYAIPSPYLEDGSRNPNYYSTESPSSTNNGQADFDGVGKTQLMLDKVTVGDWETSSTITNSYSSGNYPSACCCWRYHTDGTSQGDWYLPALGEISYMIVRRKVINETISSLNAAYGVGVQLDTNNYYWSSTEYSSSHARNVYTNYGTTSYYNKTNNYHVRAFLRV